MEVDRRRSVVRRRLVRFYSAALLIWVVALVVRVSVFGPVDSPISTITIAASGLVLGIGLAAAWRDDRH